MSTLRCSHCLDPGQSADAPSPAVEDSPSRVLATVVAEMSVSGAARAPQAPRAVPPQHQRQQQSAAATGPRGTPSYYAAIDCDTCGLPLGGTGIIIRGRVVHDSLSCSVGVPHPPVAAEGSLLRERAARVGAVSLTAQAAGGLLIDGVPNPLAPALELAAAIEARRLAAVERLAARSGRGPLPAVPPARGQPGPSMAGHGAWGMDGHVHRAQPGASTAAHTPAQRLPDRPDGRVRETTPFVQGHVAGGEAAGSIISRTRISETLAPARLDEIVRCIDGGCDAARCRFAPTPCTGCHRSLHVAECGRFGSGRAAMGLFTCHHCRALEMAPGRAVTLELMRSAKQSMVLELSLGAESTAASVAQYNQLRAQEVAMRAPVAAMGTGGGGEGAGGGGEGAGGGGEGAGGGGEGAGGGGEGAGGGGEGAGGGGEGTGGGGEGAGGGGEGTGGGDEGAGGGDEGAGGGGEGTGGGGEGAGGGGEGAGGGGEGTGGGGEGTGGGGEGAGGGGEGTGGGGEGTGDKGAGGGGEGTGGGGEGTGGGGEGTGGGGEGTGGGGEGAGGGGEGAGGGGEGAGGGDEGAGGGGEGAGGGGEGAGGGGEGTGGGGEGTGGGGEGAGGGGEGAGGGGEGTGGGGEGAGGGGEGAGGGGEGTGGGGEGTGGGGEGAGGGGEGAGGGGEGTGGGGEGTGGGGEGTGGGGEGQRWR